MIDLVDLILSGTDVFLFKDESVHGAGYGNGDGDGTGRGYGWGNGTGAGDRTGYEYGWGDCFVEAREEYGWTWSN